MPNLAGGGVLFIDLLSRLACLRLTDRLVGDESERIIVLIVDVRHQERVIQCQWVLGDLHLLNDARSDLLLIKFDFEVRLGAQLVHSLLYLDVGPPPFMLVVLGSFFICLLPDKVYLDQSEILIGVVDFFRLCLLIDDLVLNIASQDNQAAVFFKSGNLVNMLVDTTIDWIMLKPQISLQVMNDSLENRNVEILLSRHRKEIRDVNLSLTGPLDPEVSNERERARGFALGRDLTNQSASKRLVDQDTFSPYIHEFRSLVFLFFSLESKPKPTLPVKVARQPSLYSV